MARQVNERVRLLHGPYHAPRLAVGDRAACLFRDCLVYVTAWTDAPISWPRCRPVDVRRYRQTLLVDEELARAVRLESAAAIRFWWGVGVTIAIGRTGLQVADVSGRARGAAGNRMAVPPVDYRTTQAGEAVDGGATRTL